MSEDIHARFISPFITLNGNAIASIVGSNAYPEGVAEMVRRFNDFPKALKALKDMQDRYENLKCIKCCSTDCCGEAKCFADERKIITELEYTE
jgi:hypothetical protein